MGRSGEKIFAIREKELGQREKIGEDAVVGGREKMERLNFVARKTIQEGEE